MGKRSRQREVVECLAVGIADFHLLAMDLLQHDQPTVLRFAQLTSPRLAPTAILRQDRPNSLAEL